MPAPSPLLNEEHGAGDAGNKADSDTFLPNGVLGSATSGPLPPELIISIFALTLPNPSDADADSDPRSLPPYTLTHVCSAWRALVLGAPQLWNDVATGYFGFDSEKAREVLGVWVGKAGAGPSATDADAGTDVPLSVRHVPKLDERLPLLLDEKACERYMKETQKLVDDLVDLAPRLQTLSLRVLKTKQLGRILDDLTEERPRPPATSSDYQAPYPLLEELELSSTDPGEGEGNEDADYILNRIDLACPRLRSLRLNLLSPTVLPSPRIPRIQHLRSFSLTHCSSHTLYLRWLDVLPSLESLSLRLSCSDSESDFFEDEEMRMELEEDERYLEAMDVEGLVEAFTATPVPPPSRISFLSRPRMLLNLRALDVRGAYGREDLNVLFRVLEAPELVSLKVGNFVGENTFANTNTNTNRNATAAAAAGNDDRSEPSWTPLKGFLVRCASKLEEVEITESGMAAGEMKECLELLKEVRCLRLGKLKLEDAGEVLRCLTLALPPAPAFTSTSASTSTSVSSQLCDSTSTSTNPQGRSQRQGQFRRASSKRRLQPPVPCPKLEELYLPHATIPFDEFVEMVHSRSRSRSFGFGDASVSVSERREWKSLKVVGVDVKTARKSGRDERMGCLLEQGLVVQEVENDMIMAL